MPHAHPNDDDDDLTTTRHHHNSSTIIGTPVTGSRADFAAIMSAVNTSVLNVSQATLCNALAAYAAP